MALSDMQFELHSAKLGNSQITLATRSAMTSHAEKDNKQNYKAQRRSRMSKEAQMIVVAIGLAVASGIVWYSNGFQASPLVLFTLGLSVLLCVCAYLMSD